jgi:hypothetical protein
VVAIAVSLLVLPDRARALGLDAAARALELAARLLPELLAGFRRKSDVLESRHMQDELGQAVSSFHAIAADVHRERLISLAAGPDPAVLARTLLRLRHDLVIIGRAGIAPLPQSIAERLRAPLRQIGASAGDYFLASAVALTSRHSPPPLEPVDTALVAYASEIAAMRRERLTHTLTGSEVERLFALSFALEQLKQNLSDLARCVQEWARGPGLIRANRAARRKNGLKGLFAWPWSRSSADKPVSQMRLAHNVPGVRLSSSRPRARAAGHLRIVK